MIRLNATQRDLHGAFRVAFTDGGLKEAQAARAATTCLYALVAGWNPSAASNLKASGTAPASTYSTWLGRIRARSYVASVNQFLRKTVRIAIREHPPDGKGVRAIGDVHQVPRWPDHPSRLRKTSRRVRQALRLSNIDIKATASNKKALFCGPWLVGMLAWTSAGVEWRIPYHATLLHPGEYAPDYHAEILCRTAKALVPFGSSLSLDRFYGTTSTRQTIRRHGFSYRQRLIVHSKWYQYLKIDGRRLSSWQALQETVNHPDAELRVMRITREGRPRVFFMRKIRAQFEKDDAPIDLVISACAKPRRGKDGRPGWELNGQLSLVVAAPPGSDMNAVLKDYRKRWDIEAMFRSHVNLAPKPAPKTIPSHVVAFLGHFLHMALASVLQSLRFARGREEITIVYAAKVVLGQDPFTPPFNVDRG